MTHLRIEQNNILENVSSAVIKKLYELAISGDLDNTSHLQGNLYVPATYKRYIDVLTDDTDPRFRDLTITATDRYVYFEDPQVEVVLKGYVGDGVGVTMARLETMTLLPANYSSNGNTVNLFYHNVNVTKFNELFQAINCTTIGGYAFAECSNLEEIDISNVTTIAGHAFQNCTKCKFTGVSNLSNITNLTGDWTFDACTGIIGAISLPNLLGTTFPEGTFGNCTNITSVALPNTITTLGNSCFGSDTGLTTVSGLSNVTSIGNGVFLNCSNLTTLDIDWSKIVNVGSSAFRDCKIPINNLDLSNVTRVGLFAFCGCTNITGTLTIGPNTTFGGNDKDQDTFRGDTGITDVVLSLSITSLGTYMFNGCSSLASINLSNVTSVGWRTFSDCSSLTNADLSNITYYGSGAFQECTSLGTGLTLEFTHAGTSYPANALLRTKFNRLVIHMPTVTTYDERYPIHENMTALLYLDYSDCVLTNFSTTYGCSNLSTWILPSSTTNVGWNLVYNLPNLSKFIILAETPPTYDGSEPWNYFFSGDHGGGAIIYVKDATAKAAYLADSMWSLIPNVSTRIKTLSELPSGVWTTGLYQQYEPYLSNH